MIPPRAAHHFVGDIHATTRLRARAREQPRNHPAPQLSRAHCRPGKLHQVKHRQRDGEMAIFHLLAAPASAQRLNSSRRFRPNGFA